MISQLASPSVCVIDDEEDDYVPILQALNGLYVSSIHLSGAYDQLPPKPFSKVRLVFLDLHLSASLGKNAASNTANVFTKVVSPDTAPIVVVIWSKFAGDKVAQDGVPADDQETEAQLFKRTLIDAEPKYKGRVIFIEMAKPLKDDRPDEWTEILKTEIGNALTGQSAIEALWAWEDLVSDGCAQVTKDLTAVSEIAAGNRREIKDGMKAAMQRLARAQSDGELLPANAAGYLVAVLTSLLADQLEFPSGIAGMAPHGTWLTEDPPGPVGDNFAGHMNALLLTTTPAHSMYVPGTVFRLTDVTGFEKVFGKPVSSLIDVCCQRKKPHARWQQWTEAARPVLVELSPVCDLAQGNRVNAMLVGGVIVPASFKSEVMQKDAFGSLPVFKLRWPVPDFPEQDVILAFCHRYKVTLPADASQDWIQPWFRLRELPVASIRNLSAAQAARVGYVSIV